MKLTVPDSTALKRDLAAIGRQAPYAASVALNTLANAAQRDIRAQLPGHFMLRRPQFIANTIFRQPGVDFATKTKLQAAVGIHPTRDMLAKHEEGGSKRPLRSARLAVPVNVPRTGAGLVKAAYQLKALRTNQRAFRVDPRGGDPVIAEQLGRGKNARIRVLYVLKRAVWLKPRLQFHETAERTIERDWEGAVHAGIARALETAR